METAPFKLTSEMVDVIGGRDSANFKYFISICVDGAKVIRQHTDTIMTMIEVMSYKSKFPCFQGKSLPNNIYIVSNWNRQPCAHYGFDQRPSFCQCA